MNRPIYGHPFAVLVAPILLCVLAFNFLNKRKTSMRKNAAEDTDTGASSSSTVPTGKSYEVFLSFRGLDTRNNFTDHLYAGLINAGIRAFRDDEELRQGEEIGLDLLAAIKNSKVLIPILSVNYGSSKWCLEELVQIMECKRNNEGRHIVLPIFYKVAPSDVRHQIGKFGEAFHDHERRLLKRRFDPAVLEKWKKALKEVGNLKGREANGSEADLVKSIVQEVLLELKKKFALVIPENLVGIASHVRKVIEFVDNKSRATLFVGIYGMGGIGKTTLAKTIYNELSNQFKYCSFIADIKESCKHSSIHYLQKQLISDTLKQEIKVCNEDEGIKFLSSMLGSEKVLILLDDMDDDNQLKALAGNHNWFSLGSIVIITTRNKSILDNAEVDYSYELDEMDKDTSLVLFSRHAFRMDAPPSEFEVLTRDVVSATGGLPLSLEVLGSFLRNKKPNIWRDTIKKLRYVPHKKVQERLRISYDALEYGQQQIFLDIACFSIGTDKRATFYMWDTCGFYPSEGIEVLRLMSLIKVGEDHILIMHDQLRDLGREIVRKEDEKEPGNRSRLWESSEVWEVLKEDKGTKKIEAICINIYNSEGSDEDNSEGFGKAIGQGDNILTGKQFKILRNLRFLQARGTHLHGDFGNSVNKLKWLEWQYCPSTFEAKNFHLEELLILNLSRSKISDEWQGWSSIVMASKLKYLDLSSCKSLQKTSFLSAFRNLEVLILKECGGIKQIDSSIGNMKSLVCLDLTLCEGLKELPAEVSKLEALEQLLLQQSGIEQLPDSIGDLQNLEILNLLLSRNIKALPIGIGRLRKLRDLDASLCTQLEWEMPESIRHCSSLQRLDLQWCKKLQLPPLLPSSLTFLGITCQSRKLPSLSNLTHLKELRLTRCGFLECLWENPSALSERSLNTPFELEILEIDSCELMQTLDVSQFEHLKTLSVLNCVDVREIHGLVRLEYLESLMIHQCGSIERINLPKFQGLKRLRASVCKNLAEMQGLNGLESLEQIDISYTPIQRLDISNCNGLKRLSVKCCKNSLEVQGLDRLESLKFLDVSGCTSFESLPDMCCFDTLQMLAINRCDNLHDIQSLERFPSCTSLRIEGCKSLTKFPNLSNFRNLHTLLLSNCHELREIPGLKESTSLKHITISGCSSIDILPDLSSCTNLISLVVQDCDKLTELRGLEKLEQLVEVDISGCKSLQTVLELSGTRLYQNYEKKPKMPFGLDDCVIQFGEENRDESEQLR